MRLKTVKVPEDKIVTIYYVDTKCPYCSHKNSIEDDVQCPESYYCDNCEKEFNIKYTSGKGK